MLALVGTLLFGLIGARLWFLQTVEQESLQEEVDTTKLRTVPLLPERGRIFDADGRIMADNQRVLTVAVDWSVIRRDKDRAEIFRRLSGWINVPVEDMEDRFQSQVYSPFLPMPVAEDVDERTATAIQERVEDLPGVSIVEESRRVYPYAPLASHVVGYMGRITAETEDEYTSAGYYLNERVGQFGVELSMEDELHGTWGYVTYEVDNASRIVREVERVPPINGNDIQLTIDLDQQQFAEQALETQLAVRRQQLRRTIPLDPETNFETRVFPEYPRGGARTRHRPARWSCRTTRTATSSRWRAIRRSTTGGSNPISATASSSRCSRPWSTRSPARSIPTRRRSPTGRSRAATTSARRSNRSPRTPALNTGLIGINDYYQDTGRYTMESVEPRTSATRASCAACTRTPRAPARSGRACTATSTSRRRSRCRATRSSTASAS